MDVLIGPGIVISPVVVIVIILAYLIDRYVPKQRQVV